MIRRLPLTDCYDKDVFNGDIGFVRNVDMDAQEVVVDFDGRPVTYDFGELDELLPAFATTVHKAQGVRSPALAPRSPFPNISA